MSPPHVAYERARRERARRERARVPRRPEGRVLGVSPRRRMICNKLVFSHRAVTTAGPRSPRIRPLLEMSPTGIHLDEGPRGARHGSLL